MSTIQQLSNYCAQYLKIQDFRDYCPNGLQVEGRTEVKKLATGVTASLSFIEQALEWGADALLVHHGYFWKNEDVSQAMQSTEAVEPRELVDFPGSHNVQFTFVFAPAPSKYFPMSQSAQERDLV